MDLSRRPMTANPAEALRAGLVRWLATAPGRFTLDEAAQGIGRTLPLAQADRNRIGGMLRGAGYRTPDAPGHA